MSSDKKARKLEAKLAKKAAKAELKAARRNATADRADSAGPAAGAPRPRRAVGANRSAARPAGTSPVVRYAETVRGVLYVIVGGSVIVALALGQRGSILSLEDIIDSLFAARAGKLLLGAIGVALVIYGLKHLRLVR